MYPKVYMNTTPKTKQMHTKCVHKIQQPLADKTLHDTSIILYTTDTVLMYERWKTDVIKYIGRSTHKKNRSEDH